MGDELFKKIYKKTRVVFFIAWAVVVLGTLIKNETVVVIGTVMALLMALVYIILMYKKEATENGT